MKENLQFIVPTVVPVMLFIYALIVLKSHKRVVLGQSITLFGIALAILSCWIVFQYGPIESGLLGSYGLGFSVRMDALSIIIFTMISILSYVILKFSHNYMDGDARKHVFFSRLAVTVASVQFLILSGNLFQILFFWIVTSFCLHYLLVFYRTRPQAVAAARKKFIVARIGDVSLLLATALLFTAFGTGNLQAIFESVANNTELGPEVYVATALLVFAAVLKSAQFPSHGWLIEVVETPTPVSALLHAGLLNAGPFLMVRMSPLMVESTSASMMLIIIGGFTAMFASIVYLTQPSIKVALGYSSIAHMGFSLLMCGFGVYSAAILHIVAHSFYKAHSFLSSGSIVDYIRSRKIDLPKRKGSIVNVIVTLLFTSSIYLFFCDLWGLRFNDNPNLFIVGAIIALGVSQILVNIIDVKSSVATIALSILLTCLVMVSFFTFESMAHQILLSEIPQYYNTSLVLQFAMIIVLILYSLVIFIQLLAPNLKQTSWSFQLGVHIRNGLYANVLFDRVIGSLKHEKFKWANLEIKEESIDESTIRINDKLISKQIEAL